MIITYSGGTKPISFCLPILENIFTHSENKDSEYSVRIFKGHETIPHIMWELNVYNQPIAWGTLCDFPLNNGTVIMEIETPILRFLKIKEILNDVKQIQIN